MKKLINIEYLKISNYKTAKIFIFAYFAILVIASIGLSQDISFLGIEFNLDDYKVFDFPNVWHFISYFAALIKLLLAIVIITTVTNEYSYGTMKQNLIDGLTKKDFVLSKTLTAILFSLISTIFVFLIALTLGIISTDGDYNMFAEIEYIPAYFLKLIAFFAFCIFLSILVKKSAFAFALFFIWWIIEAIIAGIETFVRMGVLNQDLESVASLSFSNYLPLSSMAQIIPMPLKRIEMIDAITQGQLDTISVQWSYVVATILYFVLFTYASYWLIKRRDL